MKSRHDLLRWACMLLLLCGVFARPATGAEVTSEGFDALAEKATLYMTVPMGGVIGVDSPPKGVKAALQAAADNPHITHAVFMIDSERGWLLEREHVGTFSGDLVISAVVRDAIAPAIFPAFFADHIFMTENALIGGLPLHLYVAKGSEEVTAKQVGIFSSMLASAAQSRGHDEAVAYAMIDTKRDLYYWTEDGEPVLSNEKPDNSGALTGFEQIKSAVPSATILLDRDTAVRIGLAKPIDDFDDFIVGEYLGHDGWLPANQFGRVCNEIGGVLTELEELRTLIREFDKRQRASSRERHERGSEEAGYAAFKRNLDRAVDRLDKIIESLEKVYDTHPERHAYFLGEGGVTIIEDADAWSSDVNEALNHYGTAKSNLDQFARSLDTIGEHREFLHPVLKQMGIIGDHLNGIRRHGNAAYWQDHAKPDLPDDIYG